MQTAVDDNSLTKLPMIQFILLILPSNIPQIYIKFIYCLKYFIYFPGCQAWRCSHSMCYFAQELFTSSQAWLTCSYASLSWHTHYLTLAWTSLGSCRRNQLISLKLKRQSQQLDLAQLKLNLTFCPHHPHIYHSQIYAFNLMMCNLTKCYSFCWRDLELFLLGVQVLIVSFLSVCFSGCCTAVLHPGPVCGSWNAGKTSGSCWAHILTCTVCWFDLYCLINLEKKDVCVLNKRMESCYILLISKPKLLVKQSGNTFYEDQIYSVCWEYSKCIIMLDDYTRALQSSSGLEIKASISLYHAVP